MITAEISTPIFCAEQPRTERRASDRFRLSRVMTARKLGSDDDLAGRISDISVGGMRVQVPEPVKVDEFLAVWIGPRLFIGEVRYCIPSQRAFSLGLQFTTCLDRAELGKFLREDSMETDVRGGEKGFGVASNCLAHS